RPDVVVLVHANGMRELEAVIALPDLPDEGAVLVELEEARGIAPVIHVDVALRVRGDRDRLTEVLPGRQLEEVRHRGERDLRHASDGRLRLSEQRDGSE